MPGDCGVAGLAYEQVQPANLWSSPPNTNALEKDNDDVYEEKPENLLRAFLPRNTYARVGWDRFASGLA
ncbi:MAG TPA: hypothetical protein VHP35_14315 [Terriglobia bacterium]|nr:hypothetical protein [Terriglobia bacterium]